MNTDVRDETGRPSGVGEPAPRWRLGLLAALAVLALALFPHVSFRLARGADWNGTTAHAHGDEAVYAAYAGALIDGRPRRADPYTGRDDSADAPLAESYFSIQFVPAYAVALPARAVGASAAHAFLALTCFAALASALVLFRLLFALTRDSAASAVGALVVLCLGSAHLAAEYALGLGVYSNPLPFLRRYVPALPFPVLFVFCGLAWHALISNSRRAALLSAAGVGVAFALLVFSYFYLWTTAAAWLACLALVWGAARREDRRRLFEVSGVVCVFAAAALVPYFALLSARAGATDDALLLTASRAPDLLRAPEFAGALALAGLFFGSRRGLVRRGDGAVLFASACALTPFVVFNQQVLTGRSLQPFHYGMFSANYVAALALFLAGVLLWRGQTGRALPRAALAALASAALMSGAFETALGARRFEPSNVLRDEARPAALRLRALGRDAHTGALDTRSTVLATDYTVADTLSPVAPQPVLWSPHLFNFPGTSLEEDRERLSHYLYLTGVTFDDVDPARLDSLDGKRRYVVSSLIRRARHNPHLSVNWTPITPEEVRAALDAHVAYVSAFDRERAARFPLSYVLTSDRERVDLSTLDRWYERDAGEPVGRFTLYRVRLRP